MRRFRTRLSWLLSFWLVCQVVALAAPAVLAAAGSAPIEQLCTCPGGDHETCPMHHGASSEDASSADCAMTASCAPVDVALLSMAGGAGVLPSALLVEQPRASSAVLPQSHSTIDLPATHDTPPPRR